MKGWLVAAAIGGPLLLAVALASRASGVHHVWADVVYVMAGRICHQRVDRSFVTSGVPWPVCARCAGLYLAAPFGAVAAVALRPQRPQALRWWLMLAALPTAASWTVERIGWIQVTSLERAIFAIPLGAALAYILVRAAPSRS
jgi:uncharacterized membrane protein